MVFRETIACLDTLARRSPDYCKMSGSILLAIGVVASNPITLTLVTLSSFAIFFQSIKSESERIEHTHAYAWPEYATCLVLVGICTAHGSALQRAIQHKPNHLEKPRSSQKRLHDFLVGPFGSLELLATICLLLGTFVKFLFLQANGSGEPWTEKAQWLIGILTLCTSLLNLQFSLFSEMLAVRAIQRIFNQQRTAGYDIEQLLFFAEQKLPEQLSAISTILINIEKILPYEADAVAVVSVDKDSVKTPWSATPTCNKESSKQHQYRDDSSLLDIGIRHILSETIRILSQADNDLEPAVEISLFHFAESEVKALLSKSLEGFEILHHYPFDPTRGRLFTMTVAKLAAGKLRVYMKSDPRTVISKCRYAARRTWDPRKDKSESCVLLSPQERGKLRDYVDHLALQSLILVSLAYRDIEPDELRILEHQTEEDNISGLSNGLVYLRTLGINAPLLQGIRDGVRLCQESGIFVRFCSSAPTSTTNLISAQCNVLTDRPSVIRLADFCALPPNHQREALPYLCAFAECNLSAEGNPNGSVFRISLHDVFRALNRMAEVPAWADTNSLKFHNIKQFLQGAVRGIQWARWSVVLNEELAYLSMTTTALVTLSSLVTSLVDTHARSLIRPVHIMWYELLFGIWGLMALVMDNPRSGLLRHSPFRLSDPLFNLQTMKVDFGRICYQLIVLLSLAYGSQSTIGYKDREYLRVGSVVFNCLAWMQTFTILTSRLLEQFEDLCGYVEGGLGFGVMFVVIVVAQVLVMFFGSTSFGLVSVRPTDWAFSV